MKRRSRLLRYGLWGLGHGDWRRFRLLQRDLRGLRTQGVRSLLRGGVRRRVLIFSASG